MIRVGWIVEAVPRTRPFYRRSFRSLVGSVPEMRCGYIARHLNQSNGDSHHELYSPDKKYDAVIILKNVSEALITETHKIQAYGGKVIFDCNINYLEIWGDYFIPGTKPTPEQQRFAQELVRTVDYVIADSTYLKNVIVEYNPRVICIPDNVNPRMYYGRTNYSSDGKIRLIWSGVSKKSDHLKLLFDVLSELPSNIYELMLVSDEQPSQYEALTKILPTHWTTFSHRTYRKMLTQSDLIISPKYLVNGYEMGHTEYKITLGMSVGLPAISSPQESYIEAISAHQGGIIATSSEEWKNALEMMRDIKERTIFGQRAAETVAKLYSTPVVAEHYRDMFTIV
jgi:hypothetical protein